MQKKPIAPTYIVLAKSRHLGVFVELLFRDGTPSDHKTFIHSEKNISKFTAYSVVERTVSGLGRKIFYGGLISSRCRVVESEGRARIFKDKELREGAFRYLRS